MRKLIFLIAVVMTALGARAATISGTVTSAYNVAPASYIVVSVRDSLNTYSDFDSTDASGVFVINNVPASVPYNQLIVSTYACGTTYRQVVGYTGGSVGVNFTVCGTLAVHGNITLNGTANSGPAKVYLIRKYYDAVLKDTVLKGVDSLLTSGSSYSFNHSPDTQLMVKVALQPGHPGYSSYVPTYYSGSTVWSGATMLSKSNFGVATATNINLVSAPNPGGPGFVGGSVILGANKGTAVGDPVPGRILILTNSSGTPITYTYSDSVGRFAIGNLAMGTYKIFGDAVGKTNPALTFTLTANKPTIGNVIFEEDSDRFEGRFGPLAVTVAALQQLRVYPNPATDHISIMGLDPITGEKWVTLRNLTGAVVLQQYFGDNQAVDIATGQLPSGMYLLQLQTAQGPASFRVVK